MTPLLFFPLLIAVIFSLSVAIYWIIRAKQEQRQKNHHNLTRDDSAQTI